MNRMRIYAWYWLACLDLFSPDFLELLLQKFGSPEELFQASEQELRCFFQAAEDTRRLKIEGRRRSGWKERFFASRDPEAVIQKYTNTVRQGIQFITEEDPAFPEKLKLIGEKPRWLFISGRLPNPSLPALAVVGARRCTGTGREFARDIARELAARGVQIISGLAEGIDGAAHAGALAAGKDTYAILGSGIDVCFPKEHLNLYQKILSKGGILSEYPPGAAGLPFHFPMRNRLIAGLSDGILVVEARSRSGSLITVDRGLEQGKDIFAVPGRPGEALCTGCNRLIQSGAKLTVSCEDILEELASKYPELALKDPKSAENNPKQAGYYPGQAGKTAAEDGGTRGDFLPEKNFIHNLLETEEKIVYASLSLVPKHVQALCDETGLPVNQLYSLLLSLRTKGWIRETEKNYYIINRQRPGE